MKIITSEYVSFGHPDKVADQISDALLDAYIEEDVSTRAGIETMIKDNIVVIGGELKTRGQVDVEDVVRNVMKKIDYPKSHKLGFDDIKIINLMGKQSPEISKGVDRIDCECIGAGDQGFVVGMASNETIEYMPLGVYIARKICEKVSLIPKFGPDTKVQVSIEYREHFRPRIKSIVISTMHSEEIGVEEVRAIIKNGMNINLFGLDKTIFMEFFKGNDSIEYFINENGSWNVGGPISDCGLTGRKIVVDQYGGYCSVGGGAFSGKDMTKVDRSGAYMCRYLAKNIVDAGIADEAKVELSYVISRPEPCAINVELKNPKESVITDLSRQMEKFIRENVDLTPKGIIERFFPCGRITPIFFNTARNGHFGYNDNDLYYPWEKTDLSDKMKEYVENVELALTEI